MPLMIPIAASMLRVGEKMDSLWHAIYGDNTCSISQKDITLLDEVIVNSLCPHHLDYFAPPERHICIFLMNRITSPRSISKLTWQASVCTTTHYAWQSKKRACIHSGNHRISTHLHIRCLGIKSKTEAIQSRKSTKC